METATQERPIELAEAPAAQLPALKPNGENRIYREVDREPVRAGSTAQITKAIASVMKEVDVVAKLGHNQFHHYKYAAMQDILQRITPLLGKYGLVIFQNEVDRSMFDKEGVIAIKYEFEVAHESGETWPRRLHQTGVSRCRDSKGGWDDKSLNKCHTAARKYFLLSLFQIPTGEEDDADQGGSNGGDQKLKSAYASKPITAEIKAAILACKSVDELIGYGKEKSAIIGTLNIHCQDDIREAYAGQLKNLRIDAKYDHKPTESTATVAEVTDPETGEVTDQVVWTEDAERPATEADMPAAPTPAPPPAAPAPAKADPQDIPDSLKRLTAAQEGAWLALVQLVCKKAATSNDLLDMQSEHLTAAQQRKVTPAGWAEAVKIFRERSQYLIDHPPVPVFDAEVWLKGDLAGALSAAEDPESLAKVKDGMLIPEKDKLTPEQWKRAVKMYRERLDEIDPANALAGG